MGCIRDDSRLAGLVAIFMDEIWGRRASDRDARNTCPWCREMMAMQMWPACGDWAVGMGGLCPQTGNSSEPYGSGDRLYETEPRLPHQCQERATMAAALGSIKAKRVDT
jgi:hypothetical protein